MHRGSSRKLLRTTYAIEKKNTYQTHCIIGNIAYKIEDERRISLVLLNNILGGPGMNSRLNLALREKHGLAYNIESFYAPYIDTGVFGIYFGTDKENLEKSISLVHKELKRIKNQKLGILQLQRAKRQLFGQIAISFENYSILMLTIGKSYLLLNKVDTLETLNTKIQLISSEQLQEIANEILNFNDLSTLIYR